MSRLKENHSRPNGISITARERFSNEVANMSVLRRIRYERCYGLVLQITEHCERSIDKKNATHQEP